MGINTFIDYYNGHKKQVHLALKLLILASLVYIIYFQLFIKYDFPKLATSFKQHATGSSIAYLIVALFLMPLNWFLESKKWELLTDRFQKLGMYNAVKGVLAGVCLAIITPARIGEYGGRLINIKEGHRSDALISTFIGSMSQNFVNVVIGLICLLYFQSHYEWIDHEAMTPIIFMAKVMLLTMICIFLFWRSTLRFLQGYLAKTKYKSLKQKAEDLLQLKNKTVTYIISLSFLRYLTYVVQYLMMIMYLGVSVDYVGALTGIGVIYLFQTLIPLPSYLSVLARGEIAVQIWGIFTDNMLGILAATFGLWIINLVVPALIGYIVIWKSNIK